MLVTLSGTFIYSAFPHKALLSNPCCCSFANSFTLCRRYVAVGVVGEYIVAAGGYDGNSHLNSVELYDPVTNVWSVKCAMRSPRSNSSSSVLNNFFYVIGKLTNKKLALIKS